MIPMYMWVEVSILSQPEGRELPQIVWKLGGIQMFQSSPSPKAGSYWQNGGYPSK